MWLDHVIGSCDYIVLLDRVISGLIEMQFIQETRDVVANLLFLTSW